MFDILLPTFLGFWFVASIFGQFNAVSVRKARFQWLRRYDILGLVPTWTFFAPNPATTDYHFLYRDRLADGTVTPWTEIVRVHDRRWWHIVWNPNKRRRKVFTDIVAMLLVRLGSTLKDSDIRRRGDRRYVLIPERWHTTWPYLFLLNYVSSLPRHRSAIETQFGIFRSQSAVVDADAVEVALISALHKLDRGPNGDDLQTEGVAAPTIRAGAIDVG